MENNYFTPSIEDIKVGYEFEVLIENNWIECTIVDILSVGVKISGKDNSLISSFTNFDGYIRTSYLTKEQIENCGFTLKHKSIDYWFQINEEKRFDTDLHNFCGYKAYDVFLNYGFHDRRLKIKSDFSGGGGFDKAETLYDGECKCINELKQILKHIHITPFYEHKD